jgi:hypothetical protein
VHLLDRDVAPGEQPGERPAAALALALGLRALLGVALDAVRADAVDVAEDRAGEVVERRRLVARRLAGGHEPLPRQPRAEAVGAQERVEAAAAAELGPPELDVQAARVGVLVRRVLDAVDEPGERRSDAHAERPAERALERTRVRGDLLADGDDDGVGELGQRRAERCGERAGELGGHLSGTYRFRAALRGNGVKRRINLCHTLKTCPRPRAP